MLHCRRCLTPRHQQATRVCTSIAGRENSAAASESIWVGAHPTKSPRHTWTISIIRSHCHLNFSFTWRPTEFGAQTCGVFENGSVPRLKIETILHFSRALMGCFMARVRPAWVDFVVYRDGLDIVLESSNGAARIERRANRQTVSYRYVNLSGDPLELDKTVTILQHEGKLDEQGFATDSAWFEKTNSHRYPDALANIYASLFTARVKHTADLLISLKDGFYYGWSPFDHMIRLAATHGNALRSSSNAFLMSTHRELPDCVRADDAKGLLKG